MNRNKSELAMRPTPIRILVVEDDPEMVAIYGETFLAPEFEVYPVRSATEALEFLESAEKPFDVVIANKSMPEIAGIILLRKIKKGFPYIRVIMVNGYGNWPKYIDVHSLGVCKVIDKPFKMAELKNLVCEPKKSF
jgi:DNA-binding NtrC family response regulator